MDDQTDPATPPGRAGGRLRSDAPPPGGPLWVPGQEQRERRPLTGTLIAAALFLTVLGVVIARQLWFWGPTPSVVPAPVPAPSHYSIPSNVDALAATTAGALVDVTVTLAERTAAAGTGMVLDADGEVLTNNHVVEGALAITATDVGNGRTYSATVVGYSHGDDVAVLHLSGASGLQTVALGDSSGVAVGEGVIAMGNAQGAGGAPAYSYGTITAKNRTVTAEGRSGSARETLTGLLETDATIVSGDSGGPLIDLAGKVIGMITAGSAGFRLQGRGYAIPTNSALAVVRRIESGRP